MTTDNLAMETEVEVVSSRATTSAEIDAAAQTLADRWRVGAQGDPGFRAACGGTLKDLRATFRRCPEAFSAATVTLLRSVGRDIERGLGRAAPGALRLPFNGGAPKGPPPLEVLREVFGYPSFRAGQQEIIETLLTGRDCVGIMPTGAGKSLTYQIPARVLGGLTLVVSPLIALMKDQVDAMTEVGLRATYLSASLPPEERQRRVRALAAGEYELCYAAPEGIEASVGRVLSGLDLRLIAVDEAHCISQWGHDFRPAYRNLTGLKRKFGGLPILALTATATPAVTADIIAQLAMADPACFRGRFFRPNLHLSIYRKGDAGDSGAGTKGVRAAIRSLVHARRGQSGIVYALSRKACESLADHLRETGVAAAAYHAGLDPAERTRVQDAFARDEIDVVVATVAFGMGIDKSNVRYVIHRDMPRSIESYYQEIGRAGRDGLPSDCVLFYSWADVMAFERFGERADDVDPAALARQREQIREMFAFAAARDCHHRLVARHLGEQIDRCGTSCASCAGFDPLAAARDARRAPARPVSAPAPRSRNRVEASDELAADTAELFERLRTLRRALAGERGVPAYVVFSDATLMRIAEERPSSAEALLRIPGIGPKKLGLYGDALLAAVR